MGRGIKSKEPRHFGVSDYLKPKQQTIKELEAASVGSKKKHEEINPVDAVNDDYENMGVSQWIKNIFEK